MARTNRWGELIEEVERTACGNALRKLRRATSRGRMSAETAREVGGHMALCATEKPPGICRYTLGGFNRRFGHIITGVSPHKVRPPKMMSIARVAPAPTAVPAPPSAPIAATNGTASAKAAPKPKSPRRSAATGTPKRRRSRARSAAASK